MTTKFNYLFISSFDEKTYKNKQVDGKMTLSENIADNGGLREAFWAYRNFVAEKGEENKLPGLEDYSNDQIFFLAFVNVS